MARVGEGGLSAVLRVVQVQQNLRARVCVCVCVYVYVCVCVCKAIAWGRGEVQLGYGRTAGRRDGRVGARRAWNHQASQAVAVEGRGAVNRSTVKRSTDCVLMTKAVCRTWNEARR